MEKEGINRFIVFVCILFFMIFFGVIFSQFSLADSPSTASNTFYWKPCVIPAGAEGANEVICGKSSLPDDVYDYREGNSLDMLSIYNIFDSDHSNYLSSVTSGEIVGLVAYLQPAFWDPGGGKYSSHLIAPAEDQSYPGESFGTSYPRIPYEGFSYEDGQVSGSTDPGQCIQMNLDLAKQAAGEDDTLTFLNRAKNNLKIGVPDAYGYEDTCNAIGFKMDNGFCTESTVNLDVSHGFITDSCDISLEILDSACEEFMTLKNSMGVSEAHKPNFVFKLTNNSNTNWYFLASGSTDPQSFTTCVPSVVVSNVYVGIKDLIDDCIAKRSFSSDSNARCFYFDVLSQNNCGDMADLDPRFCEGLADTYPNNGLLVEQLGVSGIGGCQQSPDTYTNPRDNGRDWYGGAGAVDSWSDTGDFPASSAVYKSAYRSSIVDVRGKCCGNDINDVGTFAPGSVMDEGTYNAKYVCFDDSETGDFVWKDAANLDVFKSFGLMSRIKCLSFFGDSSDSGCISLPPYEIMSNSKNWFVCGVPDVFNDAFKYARNLDSDFMHDISTGALLGEYWTLPPPTTTGSYGVTPEGGTAGDDFGESLGDDANGAGNDGSSDTGASAAEGVTIDSFEDNVEVTDSAGLASPCDFDQDGFDADPTFISNHFSSYTGCSSPTPPYDCNDTNSDFSPGRANVCHPKWVILPTPHWEFVNKNYDCSPEGTGDCIVDHCFEYPDECNTLCTENCPIEIAEVRNRFMCHDGGESKDGSLSSFSECCGWNAGNCIDSTKQGRREGAAINTVTEFDVFANEASKNLVNLSNIVLKLAFTKPLSDWTALGDAGVNPSDMYYMEFQANQVFDERFRDWSKYSAFEFDVYFAASFEGWIWFGKYQGPDVAFWGNSFWPKPYKDYATHNRLKILDYVAGEPHLGQWMHVRIPMSVILSDSSDYVDIIRFGSSIYRTAQLNSEVKATLESGGQKSYSNIIGLDKFTLQPKKSSISSNDISERPITDNFDFSTSTEDPADFNYYCSGGWPPEWIGDLDYAIPERLPGMGAPSDNGAAGQSACDAIPSFKWTGSACCGDDNAVRTSSKTPVRENYVDSMGACFNGEFIADGEVFSGIEYEYEDPDDNFWRLFTCKDRFCNILYDVFGDYVDPDFETASDLPRMRTRNMNVYQLLFLNGGEYTPVSKIPGEYTEAPSDISILQAKDVSLRILFQDGGLHTCHGVGGRIEGIDNTNTPEVDSIFGDTVDKYDNCEIYWNSTTNMGAFCSHIDGRNLGWDYETLKTYPGSSVEFGGTDATPEELTYEQISGEVFGGEVPVKTRTEEKENFNLIKNGGFEDVSFIGVDGIAYNSDSTPLVIRSEGSLIPGWSITGMFSAISGNPIITPLGGSDAVLPIYTDLISKVSMDPTAPGFNQGNRFVLEVSSDDGTSIEIKSSQNSETNVPYTLSFDYVVVAGGNLGFDFTPSPTGWTSEELGADHWSTFTYTFVPKAKSKRTLKFYPSGAPSHFKIDNVQLTKAEGPSKFVNFDADVGCCPKNYCWTGGAYADHPSCIHEDFFEKNVSMPPIGWDLGMFGGDPTDSSTFIDAPDGFRCIDGNWKFQKAKYTPLFDGAGYCTYESQCFTGTECVNSGEFTSISRDAESANTDTGLDIQDESFYCYEGEWTTRTKEVALRLLNMTDEGEKYTLFCDSYEKVLNPAVTASDTFSSVFRSASGDQNDDVTKNLLDIKNELCVLNKDGTIIGGVSLNDPINVEITAPVGAAVPGSEESCVVTEETCPESYVCDTETAVDDGFGNLVSVCVPELSEDEEVELEGYAPKTFLSLLGKPDSYCDNIEDIDEPTEADDAYFACGDTDVYYNPKLQTVLFAVPQDDRNGEVPYEAESSFIGAVFNFLKDIIQNLLGITGLARSDVYDIRSGMLDFVERAGSFDKLYISNDPTNDRTIRAIRDYRFHRGVDDSDVFSEIYDSDNYNTASGIRSFISAEYHNYQVPMCQFIDWRNKNYIQRQFSAKYDSENSIRCNPVILDGSSWMYDIYVEAPIFSTVDALTGGLIPVSTEDEPPLWIGASDNFWNDITAKIRTQDVNPKPTGSFTAPTFTHGPLSAGNVAEFAIAESYDSENLIAMTWDFGDGHTFSGALDTTATHRFLSSGDYDVTLSVMNDEYKISSYTESVTVTNPLSVTVEPVQGDGEDVTFNINILNGVPPYTVVIYWNLTQAGYIPNNPELDEEYNIYEGIETQEVSKLHNYGSYEPNNPTARILVVDSEFASATFDTTFMSVVSASSPSSSTPSYTGNLWADLILDGIYQPDPPSTDLYYVPNNPGDIYTNPSLGMENFDDLLPDVGPGPDGFHK